MALTATLTRGESLSNPVTLAKLRDLIDKTSVSVGGTLAAGNVPAKLITGAMVADGTITETQMAAEIFTEMRGILAQAMFLGEVRMFCHSDLPAGWALCDGTERIAADYPLVAAAKAGDADPFEKYTAAGQYSAGYFAVPDLRGKFIRVDDGAKNLETAVAESMPSHRHSLLAKVDPVGGENGGTLARPMVPAPGGSASTILGGPYGATPGAMTDKNSAGTYLVDAAGGAGAGTEIAPAHMYLVFAVFVGAHEVAE